MMQYDRMVLGRQARELGFVRDTFEKICRLADVLKWIHSDSFLAELLALKGGTALNLMILDLPRLSVDIDLDFSHNLSRDEMMKSREILTERIKSTRVLQDIRLDSSQKLIMLWIPLFLSIRMLEA